MRVSIGHLRESCGTGMPSPMGSSRQGYALAYWSRVMTPTATTDSSALTWW
jgi:hypothetical protein